jgi:hypothetical protein
MAIEQEEDSSNEPTQNGREKPEEADRDGLLGWHRVTC